MIINHFNTSIRQLQKNKGRSALTMLGIIIGIGSVIFIMTTGEIAKNFLLGQLTQFGTNVVEVSTRDAIGFFQETGDVKLEESDVDTLYDSPLLPEIAAISAGFSTIGTLEYEGQEWSSSVIGDRPEFFQVNNMRLLQGRLFQQADMRNEARVLVIGKDVAEDIFGHTDVIGERVKISGTIFRIIGIIEDVDFSLGFVSNRVYAPITTVKKLFADDEDNNVVGYLLIEFSPGTNVDSFTKRVDYELRRAHNALDIFDTILLGIQMFVSAVAAISLVVGGIGIMNIMLVIVRERTKEIGLRKAIGAKNSSIMTQFLIESIVLTTFGGIIGIVLGLGLSYLGVVAVTIFQPDLELQFVFVPRAVIIACTVAVTVGIVFGIYPALKASKLHPIEALRYE